MKLLETVKNFFSKKSGKFNTTALFKQADSITESLQIYLDAFTVDVFKRNIAAIIEFRENGVGPKYFLTGASYDYVTKHLPSSWERLMRHDTVLPLIAVVGSVAEDLRDITANYRNFFKDEEISPEDIRLSNLIIAGYIESADKLQQWVQAIVFLYNNYTLQGKVADPNNIATPAKYLIGVITKTQPYVKELFEEILSRKKGTRLLTILDNLNSKHGDVSLKSEGVDITNYADDSNYTSVELDYIRVGLINPLMLLTKWSAVRARVRYERNKELRDYIRTRIAFLEQIQQGLKKGDPEYEHYEKVCKNYLDHISKLDKEIAQYEV